MLKVGTLIKYLSENNPSESPARLSFFHYLSYLTDYSQVLTVDTVENFFASCLDFTHWQQNRLHLGEEIQTILQEALDLSEVRWPQNTQVIELENSKDLGTALQIYLNSIYKNGEKYRLIPLSEQKFLGVILRPNKSLWVRTFDHKMIVNDGQLQPLKKDLCLYYTAELDLDPEQIQKIEMAPFVTARFQVTSEQVVGCLVKGFVHQKFMDLNAPSLSDYPQLFYAIKRQDQHFINRETDSFYQEIVTGLERVNQMAQLGDPDAAPEGVEIMARAQKALEFVFAGDKLLNLLIRDLQHTLALRKKSVRQERMERLPNSAVEMTPRKVEDQWTQIRSLNQSLNKRKTNPTAFQQPAPKLTQPTNQSMTSPQTSFDRPNFPPSRQRKSDLTN